MQRRLWSSPRARRRLFGLGLLVVAAAVAGLVLLLLPDQKGGIKTPVRTTGVQTVARVRQVPVTPKRRAAIDALFDRFVPAAVGRRNPAAARALATPSLRSQASLAEWRSGDIPVPPFDPAGTTFHGWRTIYSYPRLVSVELTLEPRRTQDPVTSFSVDVKLVGKRWLVDSMYQLGTHGGVKEPPPKQTAPESKPSPVDVGLKGRLSFFWILIPLGLLSLIVVVPLVLFSRDWLADRRVRRRYRDELRKELPPLPRPRDRDRTPTGRS